jgi:hypothetical protein
MTLNGETVLMEIIPNENRGKTLTMMNVSITRNGENVYFGVHWAGSEFIRFEGKKIYLKRRC